MVKELILAVAGSGKTTKILGAISREKRYLIITYANENLRSLEVSLIKKFGLIPSNVTLMSYFSFLYNFCYRPFFAYRLRDNGIVWDIPGTFPAKSNIRHYVSPGGFLFGNRLAKLIVEHEGVPKIISRLEKYFDVLLIDEVQDFAGNDFNLLMAITQASMDMEFVGDFFQHTFDTSRDGNIRANLHKRGVASFVNEFERQGFSINLNSLDRTYRCSPAVCSFITEKLGIIINSHRSDDTLVQIIEDQDIARVLFADDEKVKLFYQDHIKYSCNSNNWGKCKGLNGYGDICVVLNKKSEELLKKDRLTDLPDSSLNKLYVACSRANGDLYVLFEKHLTSFKA